MSIFQQFITSSLMVVFFAGLASANWDPATGHLYNYRPSKSWISQQKGARCFKDVQVAECAQNTRLSYPHVQLFATFEVEHSKDKNHGCPYGTCCGFSDLPSPSDMEADEANYHSFFWHDLGGISGPGTNPIANPQTGAFGYESSAGKYHEGKADVSNMQKGHDSNYPGFKLPPAWSHFNYPTGASQSGQPKCGTADGENLDPGQKPGSYGNYKPSRGSSKTSPDNSGSYTSRHNRGSYTSPDNSD
ncbi:hypothetical protein PTTG_00528 [Puccinia triticina 1-1 BBBD Race 1]|uniref:Secreted protein n=2 Tax=Puccinia triticina TaxID=208348 RepID=A0A180H5H6_PUCT1|nr:uncharacterized protein PtA15_2A495 [Puccinia triticina]OAV99683.1 hypothetical protein PTTG_00528 [Puccinia triticina 1-1 BBBD Race 1]WAQ82179.1 hypothetical protein PtA15_2A495 [Puccinia triticina]WAR53036.1 hypothetical protein PtB15_2B464 [Puccinia triticina]